MISAWVAAYFLLGTLTGFLGGLFGIGGGLLLVPVLLFFFEAQHFPSAHLLHLALGTSMATILFTSLASLRKHHELGAVNWQVVRGITPGILLGALLGAATASLLPIPLLAGFFTLFVYFAASQMLLEVRPHAARQLPGRLGLGAFGAFTGWLSTLVSIGGGTLTVPFLLWCNQPLRQAIGTAAAIGFPIALGGTLGYVVTGWTAALPAALGYVYLPALFWLALSSMLSAPLGARLAHRMDVRLLRKLFALLLMAIATRMLWRLLNPG